MCTTEIQTTEHQYISCPYAIKYWELAQKITHLVSDYVIPLKPSSILFNHIPIREKHVKQFVIEIILATKYTIYRNCLDVQDTGSSCRSPSMREMKIRLFKHINNTYHAHIVLTNKFHIWESTHGPVCRILDQREIALLL